MRIQKHIDDYWLEIINNDDNAREHWNKCAEQFQKANNETLVKYLTFCDDNTLLEELAEFLLIKFDLSHAKTILLYGLDKIHFTNKIPTERRKSTLGEKETAGLSLCDNLSYISMNQEAVCFS